LADPEQFLPRWNAAVAASVPFAAQPRPTAEPPRPLRRDPGAPDPFPIEALGEVLGAAAKAINDKVQAPIAICAQSVLAAATLVVQARADIQLPTGQPRPLSGYFLTVAGSGERKTSADREALWPILHHERRLREQYEAELPGYLNAREAWEKQRLQILNNKKRYPDPASKRAALDELGPAPVSPPHPMLVCPEPTFEGLERLFAVGQPSMGVFSGEGGQFVGGHGMQRETKLRTAAALSGLWDGDAIRRVRALDGATLLPGRRLSVHLMVQPDVATLLLCDRLLADQGLLSRLLVTAPPSAAGTRFWREAPGEADAAIRRYAARLLGILEEPRTLAPGKLNELDLPALVFDDAARRTWRRSATISSVSSVQAVVWSPFAASPTKCLSMRLAWPVSSPSSRTCNALKSTPLPSMLEFSLHSITRWRLSGFSTQVLLAPRSSVPNSCLPGCRTGPRT